MKNHGEYFGDPERIALAKRSASLWRILREDPRFAFQGRIVVLSEPGDDMVEIMVDLAKLQGGSVCNYFPMKHAQHTMAELEDRGLKVVDHVHLRGGETCLNASHSALNKFAFPEDLSVVAVDETTSSEFVREVAEMSEESGVMPVPGWVMRGLGPEGIFLVAKNTLGEPVACAGSFMCHAKGSAKATDAFWGMLATRPDRRGQKIAFLLGAKAIIHMWEKHQARAFFTGVSAENPSSMALCTKLGLSETGNCYISCIDESVFAGSSITK